MCSLICVGIDSRRPRPYSERCYIGLCGRAPAREADERCTNAHPGMHTQTVAHSIRWPRGRVSQGAVPVSPAYFCPLRAKRHSVHYDTSISHVCFCVVAESTRASKSRRERPKLLCHTRYVLTVFCGVSAARRSLAVTFFILPVSRTWLGTFGVVFSGESLPSTARFVGDQSRCRQSRLSSITD